jgi:ABC-type taurine transport system ATPase subunit
MPHPGRGAGLVFQQPRLFPWKTVGGNVELELQYAGVSRRERIAQVPKLLAKAGLTDVAHRRTWQISGGQQQRVAIARALAVDVAVDLSRIGLQPDELRALPEYAALRATIGHAVRSAAAAA